MSDPVGLEPEPEPVHAGAGGAGLETWLGKHVLRGLTRPEELDGLPGWRPFREGVDALPIYGAASGSGPSAALLRYQPGARVPLHRHQGFEHILVLRGAQADAQGTYEAGTCIVSLPGSEHAITSETGCLVLAIWTQPVQFL